MKKTVFIILGILGILLTLSTNTLPDWLTLLLLIILILIIIFQFKHSKKQKKIGTRSLPKPSSDKYAHYVSKGMTDSDIQFFRNTMNEAKNQIISLENQVSMNSKLKIIDLKYDTVRISKCLFKEIVNHPDQLASAELFLYHHLPNLLELSKKYIEISDHEVKNKSSYELLIKSAESIEAMSQLIIKDYTDFISEDLETMEIELKIAEQNIERSSNQF